MSRALLDVNVLIALMDAAHVGHGSAHAWMRAHASDGWASCPITQNGCIRIMSQPSYPGAVPAAEVAQRLGEAVSHDAHAFWPADVDLVAGGAIDWRHVLGHRQITDAYLLALAVRNEGRFVTFDRRISFKAVKGARADHLSTIEG